MLFDFICVMVEFVRLGGGIVYMMVLSFVMLLMMLFGVLDEFGVRDE